MHLQSPYANIAFIEKSIGLNGDVVMSLADSISFFVSNVLNVFATCKLHVVPPPDPNELPRILHVAKIEGIDIAEFGEHPDEQHSGEHPGSRHPSKEFDEHLDELSLNAESAHGKHHASKYQDLYGQTTFRVHFKEINSLKEAKLLCEHFLFMNVDDLPFIKGAALQEASKELCLQDVAFQLQKEQLQAQDVQTQEAGIEPHSQDVPQQQQQQKTQPQAEKAQRPAQDAQLSSKVFANAIKVIDERYGDLGILQDVIKTPANDVWVLNGKYGEVLIPLTDECADSFVPNDELIVYTHIIDGLIDD